MNEIKELQTDNTKLIKNIIIIAINKLEKTDVAIQQVASSLIVAYLLELGFVFVPENLSSLLADIIALWEKSNKTTEEKQVAERLIEKISNQISKVNNVKLVNYSNESFNLVEQNHTSEEDIFFWVLEHIESVIDAKKEIVQLNQDNVMNKLNTFLSRE